MAQVDFWNIMIWSFYIITRILSFKIRVAEALTWEFLYL